MRYITGIHALNLPSALPTCGDWHGSAIQWRTPFARNSEDSVFGGFGIESGVAIPGHKDKYYAANHIRALLDLLETGNLSLAQGMNNDYICNDAYTDIIFEKVALLHNLPHWGEIDRFMGKEYCAKWLDFKKGRRL